MDQIRPQLVFSSLILPKQSNIALDSQVRLGRAFHALSGVIRPNSPIHCQWKLSEQGMLITRLEGGLALQLRYLYIQLVVHTHWRTLDAVPLRRRLTVLPSSTLA
ncbi:hypothetical protein AVEN_93023-1 [Araneus ventricosus]|uniref:Uncharacterized protein n=1 Tax=Araneus ventricosus TaxID=182803 RepID=A0A4Y1ZLP2_ARAVE|nr:hypothetical protein AVEN_225771-1 [Araneus ventricosus]GBL54854.1 hypothetical protein AVEN_93023-1 [Araneus ventricosus]